MIWITSSNNWLVVVREHEKNQKRIFILWDSLFHLCSKFRNCWNNRIALVILKRVSNRIRHSPSNDTHQRTRKQSCHHPTFYGHNNKLNNERSQDGFPNARGRKRIVCVLFRLQKTLWLDRAFHLPKRPRNSFDLVFLCCFSCIIIVDNSITRQSIYSYSITINIQ